MQLFFFTVIQIVNVLRIFCANAEHSNAPISSVFEAFGYSPACVASALASCEFSSKKNFSLNVADSFEVIKSHLQEMKVEQTNLKKQSDVLFNISETITAISATLEEMKPPKKLPKNCAELEDRTSGLRIVYPYVYRRPVVVYCDQVTDGGSWTVIQNRDALPKRETFERSWQDYVQGFGDLNGEFWLGLENIHSLTSSVQMELRIDLEDSVGEKRFAKYGIFHIEDSSSKYVLRIYNYSGDAGDGMISPAIIDATSNGMKFSTHDQDNDLSSTSNWAKEYRGGWWFNADFRANLNGYHQYVWKPDNDWQGIIWEPFRRKYSSMKKASMKVRPV